MLLYQTERLRLRQITVRCPMSPRPGLLSSCNSGDDQFPIAVSPLGVEWIAGHGGKMCARTRTKKEPTTTVPQRKKRTNTSLGHSLIVDPSPVYGCPSGVPLEHALSPPLDHHRSSSIGITTFQGLPHPREDRTTKSGRRRCIGITTFQGLRHPKGRSYDEVWGASPHPSSNLAMTLRRT